MTASLSDFITSLKDNRPEKTDRYSYKSEHGIPFYQANQLRSMENDALKLVKQEWAECWKNGAGVLIITDFYSESKTVDNMSDIIYKILENEQNQNTKR